MGRSALVVPVKVKKEVVGVFVVMRHASKPFNQSAQNLLNAVADYASISWANVRLFHALEERVTRLQKTVDDVKFSDKAKSEILQNVSQELYKPLTTAKRNIDMIVAGKMGPTETLPSISGSVWDAA